MTSASSVEMRFEPLFYADQLTLINPVGDVGLILLWSSKTHVRDKLTREAPAVLDSDRSRVAVMANLYGDGLHGMFCNLLFNPQVRHLIAFDQKLNQHSCEEIEGFLEHGLEKAKLLGAPMLHIPGTTRYLRPGGGLDVAALRARLTFTYVGEPSDDDAVRDLIRLLDDLPRASGSSPPPRQHAEIPPPHPREHRPSNVASHQVVRTTPLAAWEELVVRTMRFGHTVELSDGETRLELHNARAVITAPREHSREALERYGFDLDDFRGYQQRILQPELPTSISYNYGNRLRGYFAQGAAGNDTLQTVVDALRRSPLSRGAYISLWDNARDLAGVGAPADASTPCLTTLYFREVDGLLTLTATYRAHNLLTAWLQNVYGLIAILDHVADGVGVVSRMITVISHQLGINPASSRYGLATAITKSWRRDNDVDHDRRKSDIRQDPNGYFIVSIDVQRRLVVADHFHAGNLIKRYEESSGLKIQQAISGDMAISQVSHAMWVARELALKDQQLQAALASSEGARP